jgi:hypothetical protein
MLGKYLWPPIFSFKCNSGKYALIKLSDGFFFDKPMKKFGYNLVFTIYRHP